jgi:hypothetical protein
MEIVEKKGTAKHFQIGCERNRRHCFANARWADYGQRYQIIAFVAIDCSYLRFQTCISPQ